MLPSHHPTGRSCARALQAPRESPLWAMQPSARAGLCCPGASPALQGRRPLGKAALHQGLRWEQVQDRLQTAASQHPHPERGLPGVPQAISERGRWGPRPDGVAICRDQELWAQRPGAALGFPAPGGGAGTLPWPTAGRAPAPGRGACAVQAGEGGCLLPGRAEASLRLGSSWRVGSPQPGLT